MSADRHDLDYASLAARALAAGQPSTVPPPVEDRTATIAAIERALRARARRRLRPWWVLAPLGAAAAAAVLLVAGGHGGRGSRDAGHPLPSAAAANLRVGAALSGPSSIEIASGTRLYLAARATAKVKELGTVQSFVLETGGLRAEVAKLVAGRRFLIQTPDAEIEVKGTRFDVAVAPVASTGCAPGTRTHVTVHEGVVAVRFGGKEVRLGPGAEWPDCAAADAANGPMTSQAPAPFTTARVVQTTRPASRPPTTVISSSEASRRARERSRTPTVAVPGPASKTTALSPSPVAVRGASTLADQNDLLAAALAARHRGDVAEALRWLDRLLSRYPDGQLVESARAERRRLLESRASLREPESE